MSYLLKMLSDMLLKPKGGEVLLNELLYHIHICAKPKVKLSPTVIIYPAPPSSLVIATTRNPSHFGLTDGDLGLTEMGLQSLCFPS